MLAGISVLAFRALAPYAREASWGPLLDPAWLCLDVLFVTLGVIASGGLTSPWYIWYLAVASAAAFILGKRGTFLIAVANTACYLGSLFAMGQIRAVDANLALAVARMAFLHGAAFFFLAGVVDLNEKRQLIKRLKENESRKVEELTRLTGALDQVTHELADANARIREADRLKSQFLANMSHELRTPLNSIIGFSEILKNRLGPDLPPKYLKFLQNINTSGQHLLGIINDILDLSKIEAGRMELNPEPFSVKSVIDGVCHVMKGMAAKASIAFELDVPDDLPPLVADPGKFKQVLYNLLSNAVKFSPDGSVVTVTGRRLLAAGSPLVTESIQVAVRDRGIGIAPADQAIVFQEFRQADGTSTRKYEGTGLGLALVKSIVELQGGRVDLVSAPGEGSTFTVTVPLRPAEETSVNAEGPATDKTGKAATDPARPRPASGPHPAAPKPGAFASGPRHRILVIEDDPTAYESIAGPLSSAGYIPLRARNGEEAVMLAHTLRPSAITLDLVLPGLDGWEVLKTLKQDAITQNIPVLIISIVDNSELGVALGADDYLLKPIDRERLLSRLAEILPGKSRAKSILVVDDDAQVHELLSATLAPLGYETRHALSGAEGLAKAQEKVPDAIVLDLMMDGMDGFEVAERLRANEKTADIPILVLTARDLSRDDRERLSGKINALIRKGERESHDDVAKTRLVSALESLLKRRSGERPAPLAATSREGRDV